MKSLVCQLIDDHCSFVTQYAMEMVCYKALGKRSIL